ncbi:MAG TPA: M1 family metallopeptidase [Steroidobacteraceae bacterium]|nr:M1 family metallopeptidase [Steroidobacteraceae bacterium]
MRAVRMPGRRGVAASARALAATTALALTGCAALGGEGSGNAAQSPAPATAPATATAPAAQAAPGAPAGSSAPVRAAPADTHYDPQRTFAPLVLPDPVNAFRSGDGSPGGAYWQNRADYVIHATLDPQQQLLTGAEAIHYTNNSPRALDSLWIQLDQNLYRPDARTRFVHDRLAAPTTPGYALDSVEIEQGGHRSRGDYVVSDTRMQIRLPEAMKAYGGKLTIDIRYHYTVPDGGFGGRNGYMPSTNGPIYDMAQWYPRMAVYDDVRGWDTLPYLGNEFYLEYGDFDYYVTVPRDMVVAGSGELQNPDEVLSSQQRSRLAHARSSEHTVTIRSAGEAAVSAHQAAQPGMRTWHFRMKQTRDVSFAASRAFIWDAARIDLPGGGHSLAMAFYPLESAGPGGWGRTVEYLKDAVQNFSRRWSVYPYPAAIAVAGSVGGMEYPGIVFDDYKDRDKTLFWITAHEIGHTWFPMVVGFNERRHQWMDEGFNSFIDVYESEDFNHGEFAPKRDQEFAPGSAPPADQIATLLRDPKLPVMMTLADQVPQKYSHPLNYFKSAFGLVLLREQILGPERFDWAFRKFIRDWSYRHPTPSDFFRAMDSAGGEDLSWFWRGWYFHNWRLDLAVRDVKPLDGDWQQGAVITVANLQPLVLPALLRITLADGSTRQLQLPAETWIQQGTATLQLRTHQRVTAVVIDPDHLLPDADRSNNSWRASGG